MYSRQIEARSWLLQSDFSTLLSRAATVQPTEQRRVSFQRLCARVCFNLFNYHFAGTATLAFSSSLSFFLADFFCSFPILLCHSTSTEAWSCSHLSPRQLHQIQTNNPPQQHPLQRQVTARRMILVITQACDFWACQTASKNCSCCSLPRKRWCEWH